MGGFAFHELILILVVSLLIVFGCAAVLYLTITMLIRSGHYTSSIGLVISLSILAIISMVGLAVTGMESFSTMGATSVGAIAGAVSASWADSQDGKKDKDADAK